MNRARIAQFYRRSLDERRQLLVERELLSAEDARLLATGGQVLAASAADRMVENVIGVFGLPLGLGLNFLVDGRSYVVPMVVEEASIVAALSASAKVVAEAGGFVTVADEALVVGQVQVVGVANPERARAALLQRREELLNLANSLHPKMVARGGGARDLEVLVHALPGGGATLVVHLMVDTRDAMGANVVNAMCEGVAALVEEITGGRVFLRILSNLTDRALVRARCQLPAAALAGRGYEGSQVRDQIIAANDFAAVCPYRAATHNKGILNGVDAVAVATGNDWRAIEAAAHAYAGRGVRYTALTHWSAAPDGALVGELTLPLKVGIVGGNLHANPAVALSHRLLKVASAAELARLMAAVGLAQNFGALRALVTDGIQRGHMTLHARSVAASAEVPDAIFDRVVEAMVESGDIKVWKAREVVAQLGSESMAAPRGAAAVAEGEARGHGKLLLLGEHAVVHGSHALAGPIPLAVRARVEDSHHRGVHLVIAPWGVEGHLISEKSHNALHVSLQAILSSLGLGQRDMVIHVYPSLPRAMGMGGSAALAVAVVRALSAHFRLGLGDDEVNRLAFASEEVAHGNPSGVDNAVATYGRLMLFRRGEPPLLRMLKIPAPFHLVIGMSGVESLTQRMVAQVDRAWRKRRALYDGIFSTIDQLTLQAAGALEAGNIELLGELMNVNQGLLNALQVSSGELEELIEIARKNGALGAKLTGGGGGGSMLALCADPQGCERVVEAMGRRGYRALATSLEPA